MESIWSFLLQTLTVSLTAAVLLLLKYLLQDKLSPRWQYGVWGILALRILLPTSAARQVLLPLPMWAEQMKSAAEAGLSSAFSSPYEPVAVGHVLPWISGRPVSLTDWLFLLYAAGVALSVLWYLVSYLRLRLLLRRGTPVSAAIEGQIDRVAAQYGLKSCRAVAVPGLPTAFVCGLFRPVLAVPADRALDDKVLLHELLHQKYLDGLQNFLWCLLRSLHWCNPFLQWVFRRIGNDMESLCDQRVLERLEGEDRREYGALLLSAASDRYARAPGTTSISNGARQIARRIEAIARFKRYPAGMGLVSVCIALVLVIPTVWGMEPAFDMEDFRPNDSSELPRAMAASRIYRCTTPGGALDTYAKGILLQNGVYIAAASPLERQAELEASMRRSAEGDGWVAYHLEPEQSDLLRYREPGMGYEVIDLQETEGGALEGYLVFEVIGFENDAGIYGADQDGNPISGGSVLIPVTVRQENGWVVEERGPWRTAGMSPADLYGTDAVLPYERTFTADTPHGTVTVGERTVYRVPASVSSSIWGVTLDETPFLSTPLEFTCWTYVNYTVAGGPERTAGYQLAVLDSPEDIPEFPDQAMDGRHASSGGGDWGYSQLNQDGSVTVASGYGYGDGSDTFTGPLPSRPAGYAVRLFWDGELVEEVDHLEEVTGHGAT